MPTFRYIIRLTVAFFKRFKAILFVGIVLGILSFLFFRIIEPYLWKRQSLKIGVAGRFRTDNLPDHILKLIGNGLTKLNENGLPEPDLAKSWETPDKGKTWIFHLDDGFYWQDGEKLTSGTINYNFSDVKITKPDEKTITFQLRDPLSPFPVVVSKPVFKKGLLGTGDWKVINLKMAGAYVQEIEIINKKERAKRLYRFYPTEERAKLAYKLGQVDTLINIFNPLPLDSWKTTQVIEKIDKTQVVSIFFNTQDKLLGEKSVRQALIYALDKKDFGYERALTPIPPNSWAYNPQVKDYEFDVQKAKKLLNKLPEELKEGMTIKLVTTPVLLSVAEKIAGYWEAIGVKTILQVSSGIPADYQALLGILDTPKDPDQYSFWHSTQTSTNISNYKNPRIDKLLEDGRIELDLKERKKIYLDFQRFLVEDSPAAFLYHPVSYTIIRK